MDSIISKMNWGSYLKEIKKDQHHSYEDRLLLLNRARELFKKYKSLRYMSVDDRKRIGGFYNLDDSIDWAWFGSMKGSGYYKNRIINNDERLSDALDRIPLSREVYKENYDEFVALFNSAFEDPKNYLATATRLLAMKRPDIFVCLDSANKSALCKDFGVPASTVTLETYWDEIVERVKDCSWWEVPEPKTNKDKLAWQGRAAMLDAMYYEPL